MGAAMPSRVARVFQGDFRYWLIVWWIRQPNKRGIFAIWLVSLNNDSKSRNIEGGDFHGDSVWVAKLLVKTLDDLIFEHSTFPFANEFEIRFQVVR
ncbi:hypothetical protein EMIT0P258_60195 [Pseudomonas sp. IT-P258]